MCHRDADVEPVGYTYAGSGKPACCSDLVLADDTLHNNPLPLSHLAPNLVVLPTWPFPTGHLKGLKLRGDPGSGAMPPFLGMESKYLESVALIHLLWGLFCFIK